MSKVTQRKEESHERIRTRAAMLLRRDGMGSLSVHKVMEEAGLTVGGFYAHYPSREELLLDAFLGAAGERRELVRRELTGIEGAERIERFLALYLTEEHRQNLAGGCPWAALLSELPRAGSAVRERVTALLSESADNLAPSRAASLATLALAFASLILMRSVTDEGLRREIEQAALSAGSLIARGAAEGRPA